MTTVTHSCRILCSALALPLLVSTGCTGSLESDLSKVGRPDELPCPVPDTPGNKQIVYNKLGPLSMAFNTLVANPDAVAPMLGNALGSQTYDLGQYPGTASEYLAQQLEDLWARELMGYLVSCALYETQSVSYTDPETGEVSTWTGDTGLCPQWHQGGVADQPVCQELVSACILARSNGLGVRVRISMRGVNVDQGLPLSTELEGGVPPDLASARACPDADPADGSVARDCGWRVEQVGMCEPGAQVSVRSSPEACGESTLMRVCEGTSGCDAGGAVISAGGDACQGGELAFACPARGSFTVMTAAPGGQLPEPGAPVTELSVEQASYPVSESKLYTWREGAFYGNLFATSSLDPRIRVQMTDQGLEYQATGDLGSGGNRRFIMPRPCAKSEKLAQARLAWHAWFIDQLDLQEDLVVHRELFACWDPIWTEGAAYAAERICAGPTGAQVCAAKPVGPCWEGAGSPGNRCASDDSAQVTLDRDYDRCADDTGRTWHNPITVLLDEPCSLVSGACATRTVISVAAGGRHTCVVTDGGEVRCFGDNSSGQLGLGHTQRMGDDEAAAAAGPVDVGGTVVDVALGTAHTCALLDTGAVTCWGWNGMGQLGYGHITTIGDDETPAAVGHVDLGAGARAVELTAGAYHTCALLDTGAVRCWGNNAQGQLGLGHTQRIGDDESPATAGDVPIGGPALHVSAGANHSCALLASGEVRCWGYNYVGQLGLGHQYTVGDNETPDSQPPAALGGPAVQVATGNFHTCALLGTGAVRCWGLNTAGQLGLGHRSNIGDNEPVASVAPVQVGGNAVQIAAGGLHSCALLDDGAARCWGYNSVGQLGLGHRNMIGDNEVPAAAPASDAGGTLSQLALGIYHTCATRGAGGVMCWGQNSYGQLGYGYTAHIGDDEVPAQAGKVPVY